MPLVNGKALTRHELMRRVGRLDQVAGVRLVTLGDGIERGVRVLEFRTGTGFVFDVLVDRSLDVGRCELRGQSLSWLSPTGVVGPWYAEPLSLGWFRSWGGGMVVPCGLAHTLLGGVDDAPQFHQLIRPTEEYGLHGRIGFMPARLTGYGERWDGDECVLYAEGTVRQAAVFGEAMELRRRIEAKVGERRFTIHDEGVNVAFGPTTHMYLAPQESRTYEIEIGALDGGSEIDAFAKRIEALTRPQPARNGGGRRRA